MSKSIEDRLRVYAELVDRQTPPLEELLPDDARDARPGEKRFAVTIHGGVEGGQRSMSAWAAMAAAAAAVIVLSIPLWIWLVDGSETEPADSVTPTVVLPTTPTSIATAPDGATFEVLTIAEDTVLTENHWGGVHIIADGVTLDCDGHTIGGPGSGSGVLQDNRSDVTVQDCIVTGFGTGFRVNGSTSSRFVGNTATENEDGFEVTDSTNTRLTDNTASGNAASGFVISRGTTFSILERNVAEDNGASGFVVDTADDNTLTSNLASDNRTNFEIVDADGNVIESNTAFGGEFGFRLVRSGENRLSENRAVGNEVAGFALERASGNEVVSNQASEGGGRGFVSRLGSGSNTFISNLAAGNVQGIFDNGSLAESLYLDNICRDNSAEASDPPELCDSR